MGPVFTYGIVSALISANSPAQELVVLVPPPPEVLHELDSVLALLGGVLEEHLGEALQVDAVLGEVRTHQQVLQRRLELFLHLQRGDTCMTHSRAAPFPCSIIFGREFSYVLGSGKV